MATAPSEPEPHSARRGEMNPRSAGLGPNRDGQVLVVIPALDEEGSVGSVVREVRAAGYPALVIDDGSVDRTAEVAESEGAIVLRLPVNLGVGGALRSRSAMPSRRATRSWSSVTPTASTTPRRSPPCSTRCTTPGPIS